jgi:hypothetical protein
MKKEEFLKALEKFFIVLFAIPTLVEIVRQIAFLVKLT